MRTCVVCGGRMEGRPPECPVCKRVTCSRSCCDVHTLEELRRLGMTEQEARAALDAQDAQGDDAAMRVVDAAMARARGERLS